MRDNMLRVLEEIIIVGKDQLNALKKRDVATAIELDKRRTNLIEKLKELEKGLEIRPDNGFPGRNRCLTAGEKSKVCSLIESVININREISETIKSQMEDAAEGLTGIRKLRRAFCPQTFSWPKGKNISINA